MKKLYFPEPFKHQHAPIQNVNEVFQERLTLGQPFGLGRVSFKLAKGKQDLPQHPL